MVRLSFDIPDDEHLILKITCAESKLAIKDFVHAMILKGLKDLRNDGLKKRLKESVDQVKQGKCRIISSKELDKMFKDAE